MSALAAVAARSGLPYAVRSPDAPESDPVLIRAGRHGTMLPIVDVIDDELAVGSGTPRSVVLIDPTDLDLIVELGFPRAPAHTETDLAVIGAGLAGMAAAVGGATRGLRTVVVDPTLPGGSLDPVETIADYLGFPDGVPATELVHSATVQARRAGVVFLLTERLEEILDRGDGLLLVLTSGATVACRALVLAVGQHPRPAVDVALPGVFVAATDPHDSVAVAVGSGAAAAGQAVRYLDDDTSSV